jgi:hypothetical protein
MNLRELCRIPQLPIAVLTTYNIDPLFFERVVLTDLIQGGATRIVVLADADQALSAVSQVRNQLLALGRRYRLIPIPAHGSFHPKVCIRLGSAGAVVACGSHNLTRAGWLGCRDSDNLGGNREATLAWHVKPDTHAASELRAVIESLVQLPDSPADRSELRQILTTGWLTGSVATAPEPWSWVVSGIEPLASILERRWQGRRFERMRMVCGSTDERGAMLRWAAERFGVSEAVIEMDLGCCGFDPKQLATLPFDLRIVPYDGHPKTHLKVAIFESSSGSAAIVGSANCSGAAWLRRSAERGNTESVIIFDQCKPSDFADLFRAAAGDAKPWAEVGLTTPVDSSDDASASPDHRLRQLQLHRSAGETIAVVDGTIASKRLFAVIQSSRVPLTATSSPTVFRGPMPDLVDGPETLFGHVEFEADGVSGATNEIWVDDVDRLGEAAGRHHRFDSVRRLASLGISADYRKLLEDLQVLSQTILSRPDEFPDGVAKGIRDEQKDADGPPKPLTAADVIRTLDQVSSHTGVTGSGSAFAGSVSLTGIMHVLFSEGADPTDIDPTAAEYQRSNEEKETEQAGQQASADGSPDSDDSGPTESQRRRLMTQLTQFLDRLSNPEFAAKCSARQLQQAAAFPLAVARFASRGPWVQESEMAAFAQAIQRTCELLFVRNGVTTGKKASTGELRLPLMDEVRSRYAHEGRAEDFDRIIGDGTLWLVLIASLGVLSGNVDGRFARNIILCDVARYPALSAAAVPEQLTALAKRLRRESDGDPLTQAKHVVQAFDALEAYVAPRFEAIAGMQGERASVEDWLWRPTMGYGQIVEVEEGEKARVHLRKKAATVSHVRLSYYVNLRVLAERDAEFRNLFEMCSSA